MATVLKRRGGGPKTVTSKLTSSKNAIKHGLTAKNWLNDEQRLLVLRLKTSNTYPMVVLHYYCVTQKLISMVMES